MLDLEDGREPLIRLNGPLIEDGAKDARAAERGGARLRAPEVPGARRQPQGLGRGVPRRGRTARLVFEGAAGEDLETSACRIFFTYDGFHTAFIDRLGDIGEHVESERWVLGEAGQQSAVMAQYATLFQDLLQALHARFHRGVASKLGRLSLRPLNADKPRYVALSAGGAATSPIKQIARIDPRRNSA